MLVNRTLRVHSREKYDPNLGRWYILVESIRSNVGKRYTQEESIFFNPNVGKWYTPEKNMILMLGRWYIPEEVLDPNIQ